MQNRILLVVTGVLSIVLIVVSGSSKNTTFFNTKKEENINVLDKNTNNIDKLNLEEYVVGVVAAEMPASFDIEALKAQAIASRTYAAYKIKTSNKNYDVVTDVSNQSYITVDEMKDKWKNDFSKYYNKVKAAVDETKGKVMTYDDEVIEAFYFAMSNGYTEDVSLVFSEDRDYLQSVESSYDNDSLKNFEVTKEYKVDEVCNKLNIKCPEFKINNIERSATNRVNKIIINNQEFKGTVFRSLLGLRSTDFDISVNNNKVIITTRGFGHGVGMSQYGANGMARDGKNYLEILNYYYKNIKITSI